MTNAAIKEFERGFMMVCREYRADETAEHIEKLASGVDSHYFRNGVRTGLEAIAGDPSEADRIMRTIEIPNDLRLFLLNCAKES
jgi:hypothetical protein